MPYTHTHHSTLHITGEPVPVKKNTRTKKAAPAKKAATKKAVAPAKKTVKKK